MQINTRIFDGFLKLNSLQNLEMIDRFYDSKWNEEIGIEELDLFSWKYTLNASK